MSRERWMALCFALGSLCFLIGPFPGYVELVGPGAAAVTFFVGSILFTAGGALQVWLSLGGPRSALLGRRDPVRGHAVLQPHHVPGHADGAHEPPLRHARVAAGRARLDLLSRLRRARVRRRRAALVAAGGQPA